MPAPPKHPSPAVPSTTDAGLERAIVEAAIDRITQNSRHFLAYFVDAWILSATVLGILQIAFSSAITAAVASTPVILGLFTWLLLRSRWSDRAALFFVAMTVLVVAGLPAFVNGARSPVLLNAGLLVVVSGWLLGRKAMWWVSACLAAVSLGYAVAERQGWFVPPAPVRTGLEFALVVIEVLVLSALSVGTMLKSFEASIRHEVQLQAAMDIARQRKQRLLGSLHDGIVMVDANGRVEYLNPRVCELFSLPDDPVELAGTSASALAERIVRQCRDPDETGTRLRALVTGGKPELDATVALQDGRTLVCNFTVLAQEDGRPGYVWHVRDITAVTDANARLAEANRQLERLAQTDALTDLANRRALDHQLAQEWGRAMRRSSAVTLMLMDVDWFKPFNDRYGHPAGDGCLQAVAAVLNARARRPGDLAARYGGEEFALVACDLSPEAALRLAQDICDGVRALQLPHAASPQQCVTLSVGVATVVPTPGTEVKALLAAADAALYRAKERGRCRVEAAP